MGISELLKKADFSHSQSEKGEFINTENDKNLRRLSQDEKMDLILAELKALSVVISKIDQHLTTIDNNFLSRINELMERKKEIPKEKKLEAENIIKKSNSRAEAIEKLKAIGLSQATAYRYTESFKEKNSSQ